MAITPVLFPSASQFDEVRSVNRTPIIELNSTFPISSLRSIVTSVGSATVTKTNAEFNLSTTASGSDDVIFDSAERGRYMPGYSAEVGLGIRIPTAPVGSQNAIWGYSDGTNGVYFGIDATGIYVARISGGSETKVYQSDWNTDRLDGTDVSTLTLDITRGNVFQILFTWYGYGVIEYQVMQIDAFGRQRKITVHRMDVSGAQSIQEPNLPVRVQASNGGTATAFTVYVGGRQFSIVGQYDPNERLTAVYRAAVGSIGTTAVPFLTLRKKAAYVNVPARLSEVDVITTSDALVQVWLNSTLTGASYGAIPDILAAETAYELDTSATVMTGGTVIYSFLIGASGSGVARTGGSTRSGISLFLPERQPVTLVIRSFSATITASAMMIMREEW